jgi:hypothetical protein
MTNRYFILPFPNVNSAIWDIIVELPETLRTNNIGNKCIVKLHSGDTSRHQMLNGFKEYSHSEILVEILKPEWNTQEI